MQMLSLPITPAQTAAWRKQIFQQLTERTQRELENFRHYEQAVEQVGSARGHVPQHTSIGRPLQASLAVRREGHRWRQPACCLPISDVKPAPPGPWRIEDEEMSPFVDSLALRNSVQAPLRRRHTGPGRVSGGVGPGFAADSL